MRTVYLRAVKYSKIHGSLMIHQSMNDFNARCAAITLISHNYVNDRVGS